MDLHSCLLIWFAWYIVKNIWLNDYKLYLELLNGPSCLSRDSISFYNLSVSTRKGTERNWGMSTFCTSWLILKMKYLVMVKQKTKIYKLYTYFLCSQNSHVDVSRVQRLNLYQRTDRSSKDLQNMYTWFLARESFKKCD